jgi:hypothetical protein
MLIQLDFAYKFVNVANGGRRFLLSSNKMFYIHENLVVQFLAETTEALSCSKILVSSSFDDGVYLLKLNDTGCIPKHTFVSLSDERLIDHDETLFSQEGK